MSEDGPSAGSKIAEIFFLKIQYRKHIV